MQAATAVNIRFVNNIMARASSDQDIHHACPFEGQTVAMQLKIAN